MRDRFLRLVLALPVLNRVIFMMLNAYKKLTYREMNIEVPNDVIGSFNSIGPKWIIQTSVPRNEVFENWGDYSFAQEIANALISKGQKAYIAFRSDKLNINSGDTYLVLRGLYPFKPVVRAKNLIWIISHPNQISKREIKGFEKIFAASESWAESKSKEFKKEIFFLPQATNPKKFYANKTQARKGIIFVGNAINRRRNIVHDVLNLGFNVQVIGKGWRGKIPSKMIIAESIKNENLGELYRESCVVLNDHWPDMKENGFISNRVLDGIASGAIVVSDDVKTSENLPNLHKYQNLKDLEIVLKESLKECGDLERLQEIAEFAVTQSFDKRVQKLIDLC